MTNNVHSGHRERLRQVMLSYGMDNMPEHQVLEYLLSFVVARKDTNPTAHNLINRFGSFDAVLEAPVSELTKVDGVGEVTAVFLHSLVDFYRYYNMKKLKKVDKVINSATAAIFAIKLLRGKMVEELYCILMDVKGNVLGYTKIATGTKSSVNARIRDITKYALAHNATQLVIAHNHPDTDSMPSGEDNDFTEKLRDALKPNDIKLNDHIIVGEEDCYSYNTEYKLDDKMLEDYKSKHPKEFA